MSSVSLVDFLIPSAVAAMLAGVWAIIIWQPTKFLAKRSQQQWLRSFFGFCANLILVISAPLIGGITWAAYWTGIKKADLNSEFYPDGPPESELQALLSPEIWAILSPIIAPLIVTGYFALRAKRIGNTINADWS